MITSIYLANVGGEKDIGLFFSTCKIRMALVFGRDEIGFEFNNEFKTVPANDVVRLMYYLNAVRYTIECNKNPDIQRFRDSQNWALLSFEE